MRQMLLAIDIGNSTIGIGLYPDASQGKNLIIRKVASPSVKQSDLSESVAAALEESFEEYSKRLRPRNINPQKLCVIISSVVPKMNSLTTNAIKIFGKRKPLTIADPLVVDYHHSGGLTFEVRNPETVGSDRIADAVAAFDFFCKPAAVADLGTATTISIVGRNGVFLGGAIMPGIDMMRESLASGTAKLPAITFPKLRHAIGRDTKSAIACGIIHGTAGAIEKIITEIERESHAKFQLVLTGGRAALVSPYLKRKHEVVPHLIFEGMRLIYMRHTGHAEY